MICKQLNPHHKHASLLTNKGRLITLILKMLKIQLVILERVTIPAPGLGGGRKKTAKLEVTQVCAF